MDKNNRTEKKEQAICQFRAIFACKFEILGDLETYFQSEKIIFAKKLSEKCHLFFLFFFLSELFATNYRHWLFLFIFCLSEHFATTGCSKIYETFEKAVISN